MPPGFRSTADARKLGHRLSRLGSAAGQLARRRARPRNVAQEAPEALAFSAFSRSFSPGTGKRSSGSMSVNSA